MASLGVFYSHSKQTVSSHAPDLLPCMPRGVQPQPKGLGLFFCPRAMEMTYIEQLNRIISALLDEMSL
ncbi:hypothetical protein Q7A_03470 [Methylophaga nitratireducenticrescens]|nr:hypothetical protein Q7A_03470 [Methylophaga nitratireducenticrescens]AUZ84355.1 hypothetical protein CDW43_07065 [Methylophaga nitratireducenticrescens]